MNRTTRAMTPFMAAAAMMMLTSTTILAQEFEQQEDARDICAKSMALNAEKAGQNYSDLCVHDTRSAEFWTCVVAKQQEGSDLLAAEAQCEGSK